MTAPVDDDLRAALALREDETVEVVSMPAERGNSATLGRAFTIPAQLDDAVAFAAAEAAREARTVSVGIGCLTPAAADRIGVPGGWARAGTSNAEAEGIDLLLGYRWMAVDIDPDKQQPETLAELYGRLSTLPPATALVASGAGLHGWWRLDRMVRPEQGRRLLAALADAVGGDRGTVQAARALRLPGTFNAKPHVQLHARLALPAHTTDHDPNILLEAALALAPPPAPVAQPRTPQPRAYDGNDLKERVRARYDLAAELDRVCGPARRGDWSCFAHEDRTPSLRLVQGADTAAICYGGGHPDGVGLRKDSGHVLDVFDLLAWENGISTRQMLSDLVTEERGRKAVVVSAPVGPGLPRLAEVLRRTASRA